LRLGEKTLEGYVDLIAPLGSDEHSQWFFNPRLSAIDNGAQELNLGLGYRTLVANGKAIVGVNAYYDSRWTPYNNQVNQWGLGLEALTDSVDARINYYHPEDKRYVIATQDKTTVDTLVQTNTYYDDPYATSHRIDQDGNTTTTTTTTIKQHYDRFEQGMRGYDAEVGVKLPLNLKLTPGESIRRLLRLRRSLRRPRAGSQGPAGDQSAGLSHLRCGGVQQQGSQRHPVLRGSALQCPV